MKSFVVIGLGRFGSAVAKTIAETEADLLVIDQNEDRVNLFKDIVPNAIIADAKDERVLDEIGIDLGQAVGRASYSHVHMLTFGSLAKRPVVCRRTQSQRLGWHRPWEEGDLTPTMTIFRLAWTVLGDEGNKKCIWQAMVAHDLGYG